MQSIHRTVLLNEVIEGLSLPNNSVVVDATTGGGGHSLGVCKKYPDTSIIAFDQDISVFENAKNKFTDLSLQSGLNCKITFVNSNFRDLDKALEAEKVEAVDGIIFDLGLSSDQLESSGRGFSFIKDEPLLMTMRQNPGGDDVTAMDVVNTWGEENLASIIAGYGEEKFAKKIAKGIVAARAQKKIETSGELVEVIKGAVPAKYRHGKLHPATRTFQAIRIAVNDELGALSEGLEKGFKFLKPGGRIAVISFHSLEDRIVKRFYKSKEVAGEARLINKKVILASSEEIKNNLRARSAKLRILAKIKQK